MAGKLPKDTRKLTRMIVDRGGYEYRDGGELIVGHRKFWSVRTQVKSRRKDSARALCKLAKAVIDASGGPED